MEKAIYTRPPLEILACTNAECEWYGKQNQGNLHVRKIYGRDQIRYLRCSVCKSEFSERKGTALWNCKIDEERAIAVAEHLGEGCSFKSTARLVRVDPDTVRRLNRVLGQHSQLFHDERAQELVVYNLQADERHGFVTNKRTPSWEAEIIDPASKLVLSHVQGEKNMGMIRNLLEDAASRLSHRHQVALFTDGEPAYAALFPEVFGVPYRRYRDSHRGRPPEIHYRIPRTLAHVQIIKKQSKRRLQSVTVKYRHGSKKRAQEALYALRHTVPNTSIIERRNGTARGMNASQTRRTLAFSRHPTAKLALGWWTLTVYNWCRTHRMLQEPLRRSTFSKKYVHRTPAMALGLAQNVLSAAEILRTPVYPLRPGEARNQICFSCRQYSGTI
ncbi:MAG TPA: IS1 transposase [Candidatus Binatia bacterium]|jgi:IS1 family transposase/transposase-like protein|nr:IS1 transposase [Candidatus Binatia bacterium]